MAEINSPDKTILLVEDNALNMKLAADLLEYNGFKVLKAVDGETALEILNTALPALVLLDIQLPGIDGFEVFKRIRADRRLDPVKVAALTAQAMSEDLERIKAAGISACITKPIAVKNFVNQIKVILA